MLKTCLLIIILLFVWWSVYNTYTSEGFQNSASGQTVECEKSIEIYKTILTTYNKAITDNNKITIDRIGPSLNTMKDMLNGMKCVVPTTV